MEKEKFEQQKKEIEQLKLEDKDESQEILNKNKINLNKSYIRKINSRYSKKREPIEDLKNTNINNIFPLDNNPIKQAFLPNKINHMNRFSLNSPKKRFRIFSAGSQVQNSCVLPEIQQKINNYAFNDEYIKNKIYKMEKPKNNFMSEEIVFQKELITCLKNNNNIKTIYDNNNKIYIENNDGITFQLKIKKKENKRFYCNSPCNSKRLFYSNIFKYENIPYGLEKFKEKKKKELNDNIEKHINNYKKFARMIKKNKII